MDLSQEAQQILIKHPSAKNVKEVLGHDGFYSFGPKSNLWDLFFRIDGKIFHFHREEWFLSLVSGSLDADPSSDGMSAIDSEDYYLIENCNCRNCQLP